MKSSEKQEINKEYFLSHCASGTSVEIKWIGHSDDVSLRCLCFSPAVSSDLPPILFIPGLGSVIENFSGTIKGLTKEFNVFYLETREKRSSLLSGRAGFTVRDVAGDINSAVVQLGFEYDRYIIIGYSLGANSTVESFNGILEVKPAMIFLAEPNGHFSITGYELFMAKYFWWSYTLIKPLVKIYLKIFRVNAKGDYEMYRIICRALDDADPKKLAAVLAGIAGYSIYPVLGRIDVPAVIIGTSLDKFHGNDEARNIAEGIVSAEYIDLENNIRSHSSEIADIVRKRIKKT